MTHSPNLSLAYLTAAQAQKHVSVNEAFRRFDALVQLSVSSIVNTPPSNPSDGQRVIISATPEGEFSEKPDYIAAFQDGGWAYFAPQVGWRAYVEDAADLQVYTGTKWQSVTANSQGSGTGQNPDYFGINATADSYNRLVVKSPASLFDNEGGGHQLKVNKAASTDTASLLFQNSYTGHAEMGLTGNENFTIKSSPDGSTFRDSLIVDSVTGAVSFPYGHSLSRHAPSVTSSNGLEFRYGLPSTSVVYDGRGALTLSNNRIYFCSFYVDHPVEIWGGFIAQYANGANAGTLIRAALYHLGQPDGNNWNIGERIIDFGTAPADSNGHKYFDLSTPVILQPGWYVNAVGANTAGSSVRYLKTLDGGLGHIVPSGSNTTSDIRYSGPTTYMYTTDTGVVAAGFPQNWTGSSINDINSVNSFGYHFFIPKFKNA